MIPGARIMVTGASGFIGRAVVLRLAAEGHYVHATARRELQGLPDAVRTFRVGDLDAHTDWAHALEGVETVVHAAARVHVMKEAARDPLAEFRRVNVEGTRALAQQALRAGVRRIVYISSIKVNGEGTLPGAPFRPDDPAAPSDPYGISKQEAEAVLGALPGLEVVVIRPVLVYGPGVKGNFLSMVRWVDRRVPLPLGAVHNRRSLVSLTNLVDLIAVCVSHPAAVGRVFLASDGDDLSTSDLLRRVGRALGRPARLIPVPGSWLRAAAGLLGQRAVADRLLSSLQVDSSNARTLLDWRPPASVDESLRVLAAWYRALPPESNQRP